MNTSKYLLILLGFFLSQRSIAQIKVSEYLVKVDEFTLSEITDREIISRIKTNRNKNTAGQKPQKTRKKRHLSIKEIERQMEAEELDYTQFETLASSLFELSKDVSTVEFAFKKVKDLVLKYDFSQGLSNLGFYYFEKSDAISQEDFKECYFKYLKKVPLALYGRWDFWWKPWQLDSTQILGLTNYKYDLIKNIPFDFENEKLFEFTFRLLPIWALNDSLNNFYPFLKEISNLPKEAKLKKGDGIYSIKPNTKYATYLNSLLRTLNYYTYRNTNISDTESKLIMDILLSLDTYHHPVETKLYVSILSNIYPSRPYNDFRYIFENVRDPSVAEAYWNRQKFSYHNLYHWFSNSSSFEEVGELKKELESEKIERHVSFLNSEGNILDILEARNSIIWYDSEDGYIPVRYNEIFKDYYLPILEKETEIADDPR